MKINLTRIQMCEIADFVVSSDFAGCLAYKIEIDKSQIDFQLQIENEDKGRKILLSEIELMSDALVSCLVYFDALDLYHQDAIIKLLKERADSKVREVLLR